MTLPYCSGGRGQPCRARSVVCWEAGSMLGHNLYHAAGSCADPKHAARVQARVSKAGRVRVIEGDPDAIWPDPEKDQLALDLGVA